MSSIPALEPSTNLPFALDDKNDVHLPLRLSPEVEAQGYKLTGWKEGDVDDIINLFNEPSIGKWSVRRPFPYKREHASYLVNAIPRIEAYLQILKDISSDSSSSTKSTKQAKTKTKAQITAEEYTQLIQYHNHDEPGPFPIGALRNPKGKVIGDIVLFKSTRGNDLPNTNTNTKTGSDEEEDTEEEETWEVAYNLLPSYGRMGLGSAMMISALGYVKWLGVKRVIGFCEKTNIPSTALLRKTGFVNVLEHQVIFPLYKGGDKRIELGFEKYLN